MQQAFLNEGHAAFAVLERAQMRTRKPNEVGSSDC
jgi:hypothetical protein